MRPFVESGRIYRGRPDASIERRGFTDEGDPANFPRAPYPIGEARDP